MVTDETNHDEKRHAKQPMSQALPCSHVRNKIRNGITEKKKGFVCCTGEKRRMTSAGGRERSHLPLTPRSCPRCRTTATSTGKEGGGGGGGGQREERTVRVTEKIVSEKCCRGRAGLGAKTKCSSRKEGGEYSRATPADPVPASQIPLLKISYIR